MTEEQAPTGGPEDDGSSDNADTGPGTDAARSTGQPPGRQPPPAIFRDQGAPLPTSQLPESGHHEAPTAREVSSDEATTAFAIDSASAMGAPTAQPSPHADYLEQTARHFQSSPPPTAAAPGTDSSFQPDPAWPAPRLSQRVDAPSPAGLRPPTGKPDPTPGSGPHSEYQQQAAQHFSSRSSAPSPQPVRWWNIGRDVVAGVLLFLAMLLPWNVYFGIGMGGSNAGIVALLILATILSWGSIAATYAGYWGMFSARFDPNLACRIRLALNIPYLLLVGGFVIFDAVETVKNGTAGVGVGAWLGTAGALLAGQPVMTDLAGTDSRFHAWSSATRIVAFVSMGLAGLEFLLGLGWTVKSASASGAGQIVASLVTSVVAGAVSLGVIALAGLWMIQRQRGAQVATVALGAAVLATGFIVRILPFGAHAWATISQHTSSTDVGYPGYLAWVAAAAILAPTTITRLWSVERLDKDVLRDAGRRTLLLVAVWCAGRALVHLITLMASIIGHSTISVYYGIALFAFDAVTAALAGWLLASLNNAKLPVALTTTLCGVLAILTLARLMVHSALEGYGASSGFAVLDKALPLLALGVLAVMVFTSGLLTGQLAKLRSQLARPAAAPPAAPPGNPPSPVNTVGPAQGVGIAYPPEQIPPTDTGTPGHLTPPAGMPAPTGQPVQLPPPAGVVPGGQPPVTYLVGPRPTNAMAIVALVCSLVLAPLGIIFGHISLSQIKRTGEEGRGLAIAGLVIGYIETAIALIGILIFVVAVAGVVNDIDSSIDSFDTFDSFTETTTTTYSTVGVPDSIATAIRNASVGDCFHRGDNPGSTLTEFSPRTCGGSSDANVRVTMITDDTSNCDYAGGWVRTDAYSPKIVLCLEDL